MEKAHYYSIRLLVALTIALMLVAILGAPNIASATGDHYVSLWGNDSTGDGSQVNPWRTIQYAVNQASTGDIIHVAEGTYGENVVIEGKAVQLLGGYSTDFGVRNSDVYVTTVDGRGLGNVMYIGFPADGTVIDGFKVTGGDISIYEAVGITIANNEIYNSGIFVSEFSASISIEHNSVHNGDGISSGGPSGATISNNDIWANGGYGISGHFYGTIVGNTIQQNGGGISVIDEGPTIQANSIIDNNGTGISWTPDSNPAIVGNVISGNSGWGIWAAQMAGGYIINNVVSKNSAGGIYVGGVARVSCSTVSQNGGGGGILVARAATAYCTIVNSVVWANTPQDLTLEAPPIAGEMVTVTYSDIGIGAISGEGNIAADPLFVNPMQDNYHLQGTSPCIDAGTNIGAPTSDIEGTPRPIDGNGDGVATVDMGAYEYPLTPPTVTINQAVGQADPTNASPITFTVVFSRPVSDFATGDVYGSVPNPVRDCVRFSLPFGACSLDRLALCPPCISGWHGITCRWDIELCRSEPLCVGLDRRPAKLVAFLRHRLGLPGR